MQAIRSILTVIEATPAPHCLDRACRLASGIRCELHLLICDRDMPGLDTLEPLVESLRRQGHDVRVHHRRCEPNYRTIIDVQQEEGCGLVIKAHSADGLLARSLLTPDDWQLLRHCPCPVLLVKQESHWRNGNILAAIDVDTSDPAHQALHRSILAHGFDLAHLLHGRLHVLSAHPRLALGADEPAEGADPQQEQNYREACRALQDEYGIEDEQMHLLPEPVEIAIPHSVDELQIAVTVFGSVGRTGLPGLLMGNTAELLLDRLDSDVLVLKSEALERDLETLSQHL